MEGNKVRVVEGGYCALRADDSFYYDFDVNDNLPFVVVIVCLFPRHRNLVFFCRHYLNLSRSILFSLRVPKTSSFGTHRDPSAVNVTTNMVSPGHPSIYWRELLIVPQVATTTNNNKTATTNARTFFTLWLYCAWRQQGSVEQLVGVRW